MECYNNFYPSQDDGESLEILAKIWAFKESRYADGLTAEQISRLLHRCVGNQRLVLLSEGDQYPINTQVTEKRPTVLEADVVRYQNKKEKWVALVGLLDGAPYEIFTGLQDEDEGIMLPKSVSKGRIIKVVNQDGTKRYDFQFENKRGYRVTVEGISERFNPVFWNYAKLISGVLRYRMPIERVVRLVYQLQLSDDEVDVWRSGVVKALKRYMRDGQETVDVDAQ